MTYQTIGGLSWREDSQMTLMIINRVRALASSLTVPQIYYGEVRRLLRDKIATHDIPFLVKRSIWAPTRESSYNARSLCEILLF